MKRNTQLAELKTPVKHNTLQKVTTLGALGRKMVVRRTKQHHVGENNPLKAYTSYGPANRTGSPQDFTKHAHYINIKRTNIIRKLVPSVLLQETAEESERKKPTLFEVVYQESVVHGGCVQHHQLLIHDTVHRPKLAMDAGGVCIWCFCCLF